MAKLNGVSRKALWLVALLLVVALGVSAANIYLLWDQRGNPAQAQEPQGAEDGTGHATPASAPVFVKIAPFTVNLQSDQFDDRLLYVGLTLRVADAGTQTRLEELMPLLRSRLLLLLSEQKDAELVAPGGKQALASQILALFDQPLTQPQAPLPVEEVLFTEFIVQ